MLLVSAEESRGSYDSTTGILVDRLAMIRWFRRQQRTDLASSCGQACDGTLLRGQSEVSFQEGSVAEDRVLMAVMRVQAEDRDSGGEQRIRLCQLSRKLTLVR